MRVMMYCFIVVRVYLLQRSTVDVTGPSEGGDVRGCLLTAIMILES
jgi:hypothetical protein